MKTLHIFLSISLLLFNSACKTHNDADAMGSFEADEVIISAESMGTLLNLAVNEGQTLTAGTVVGKIENKNMELQKNQVQASIQSLQQKTLDYQPQIKLLNEQLAVQQVQVNNARKDQTRIKNLFQQQAATQKQLDDINTQVDVLNKQMRNTRQQIIVTQTNVGTQNRGILAERDPMKKQIDIINEQINKSEISNPINGTVLSKYAYPGEFLTIGKPIYKIADLTTVYLRAYIDQTLLSDIKLGQKVKVRIDNKDGYNYFDGTISWINNQAEFTPKTIQTKNERENLVYAIKIKVPNDGKIKLGMYGEMLINAPAQK